MNKINIKIILLFLLIFIYEIFVSIIFVDKIVSLYNVLINPIMWLLIFIIAFYINSNDDSRIKYKTDKIQTILIIIISYIILYLLSGLLLGYTNSPFSHSIIAIIKNIWSFLIIIIFQEYVRYVLLNNCSKNNLFYFLVAILFILVEIKFYNFQNNFISGESSFKYICSEIIPIIGRNILFTYLSIVGSYKALLAYKMPLMFANLLIPIFPDYSWFLKALVELLLSLIVFLNINYIQKKKVDRIARRKIRKQNPIRNIPFIITVFLFVGFVAGFFKYMPIAVMSNSMSNLINRGDLVVVEKYKKNDKKNLKQYDIIEYQLDNSIIIHRIIKVIKLDDGTYKYITKGDYNKKPDIKPVFEKQVLGKVKFKVPKIGYPIVYLNEFFEKTKPKVEMGK